MSAERIKEVKMNSKMERSFFSTRALWDIVLFKVFIEYARFETEISNTSKVAEMNWCYGVRNIQELISKFGRF